MKKGSKTLGVVFLLLGIMCLVGYFIYPKDTDHKVSFDSDGGTSIVEQVVKNGEKANKPVNPTKENNEFIEWLLDGVSYNFDNIVTKDITLKASWKEIVKHNVKVTLDGNEYTADIVDGELITVEKLSIPDKEGYKVVFYNEKNE